MDVTLSCGHTSANNSHVDALVPTVPDCSKCALTRIPACSADSHTHAVQLENDKTPTSIILHRQQHPAVYSSYNNEHKYLFHLSNIIKIKIFICFFSSLLAYDITYTQILKLFLKKVISSSQGSPDQQTRLGLRDVSKGTMQICWLWRWRRWRQTLHWCIPSKHLVQSKKSFLDNYYC